MLQYSDTPSLPYSVTLGLSGKRGSCRLAGVNRFFCLLLVVVSLRPALAEDSSKVTALIKETQKLTTDSTSLVLAWWIPRQYWEESTKNNPAINDILKSDLLKSVQDYTVIGVVDAKKEGLGGLSFVPVDEILKTATLTDSAGKTVLPIAESDLNSSVQNLLSTMKPLFANLMGRIGQNMFFLVFPGKDGEGNKVADPLGEGHLVFSENGHSFSWRLPLASLLPEKVCPKCGEHLPGSYKFCPYDGTKLQTD